MQSHIPIVDLFAGPGGLGEGFASFCNPAGAFPFEIAVSAEQDAKAHRTLRLRAFYRVARAKGKVPESYYEYVRTGKGTPWDPSTKELWDTAEREALQLEIGSADGTRVLREKVKNLTKDAAHWVLIGGPPCQAYSLVGRARNAGIKDYRPEKDKRHFLYKHYLEIIREFRPSVFIMENVKGLLSSKVEGSLIFNQILADLHAPGGSEGPKYLIKSLTKPETAFNGDAKAKLNPYDFVIACERFGVPQMRHRVILVGIRDDLAQRKLSPLRRARRVTVADAISDLPKLRSGLSTNDETEKWKRTVQAQAKRVMKAAKKKLKGKRRERVLRVLRPIAAGKLPYASRGQRDAPKSKQADLPAFRRSLDDPALDVVLNHETRGHMKSDLGRYLYAAAYGQAAKRSPRATDFPKLLAPKHKSWNKGGFMDRFRVQLDAFAATTITSHIAKDGHYYIHQDVRQCRSLTVREAARLQTFPDNYFFEGNRTEQYTQVGNAVPPALAKKIADRVWKLLSRPTAQRP